MDFFAYPLRTALLLRPGCGVAWQRTTADGLHAALGAWFGSGLSATAVFSVRRGPRGRGRPADRATSARPAPDLRRRGEVR
ncbi:hypothetical protein ACFFOP_28795 [Sinosporangium siamense]|uniref:hypothetical protein n=1 Tax=Sinosporangium siamense TaxID=1367973 RepID=UPI0035EB666B